MKSEYSREYYDLIELIEQKFEAGEIPAEQRDFMINEATANESERRRRNFI